jgi:hypothetical protein
MTDAKDVSSSAVRVEFGAYCHPFTNPIVSVEGGVMVEVRLALEVIRLRAEIDTLTRERDEARKGAARLCQWREDDPDFGTWRTGCGHLWSFNAGGPKENDTKFCQYCGGALDAALTQEDA